MSTLTLSDDTMAILLVCGDFGQQAGRDVSPLSLTEYNRLAYWLKTNGYRPKDLIEGPAWQALWDDPRVMNDMPRLKHLLSRGASLAFAVERWTNKGIWLVCRGDEAYPKRLRNHLGLEAPPILYGIGPRDLVNNGGLAVVGSRNVDQPGADFAAQAATEAVKQKRTVISGGARGVDQLAMQAALGAGGMVIGVLAEGLMKKSLQPEMRQAIRDGRLTLVSSFQPETGWKVYQAMHRNKVIYALSDLALIVSADYNKGGTWQGATEELRRTNHVPLFVRTGQHVPRGNQELLKKGGLPLSEQKLAESFSEMWSRSAPGEDPGEQQPIQEDLFRACLPEMEPPDDSCGALPTTAYGDSHNASPAPSPTTIFEAVLPIILESLKTPRKPADLAVDLNVHKSQLDLWLKEAEKQHLVTKLSNPARFVATAGTGAARLIS